MSDSKRLPAKLSPWPIPVAFLLQIVLLNYFPHAAPMKFFASLMLILGAAILVTGVLLRFVDLPRAEANRSKDDPYPTVAYEKAIAVPFIWLGILIMGLGVAPLVLADEPTAKNAAMAVFAVLGIAALTAMIVRMVRAWRVFVARPKQE